jgi:nicotinate-nucleotide adenylyltransferase
MTIVPGQPGGAAPGRSGLGVFGGSFNPPHTTHRRLAREALRLLPIRELLVVPSGDHPHKRDRDMAPAADRLAMCRLAFGGLPDVRIDERELRRAGPSFTVDTLHELAAEAAGRPLYFLIGSDNLPLLPTWRDAARIAELCTIVTWPRRGHAIDEATLAALPLPPAAKARILANVLAVPADDVAASDLRARLRAGERDLAELDPAVRAYIEAHGLYR